MQSRSGVVGVISCGEVLAFPSTIAVISLASFGYALPFARETNGSSIALISGMAGTVTCRAPGSLSTRR